METSRKKFALSMALLCSVAALAQGCAYSGNYWNFTQEEPEGNSSGTAEGESAPPSEAVPETQSVEEEAVREVPDIYYAYHALDEERQTLYLEILDALAGLEADARLSTLDKSVIDPVFTCVMNDHPELFYVEGYQYTEYTLGSEVTGITFSGNYSMTADEAGQTALLIEESLAECFAQVPLNEDEYSTAKFLYDWLIGNTEYDRAAENNQNIRSAFLQGRSVCQGYAKAMQYLLQKTGIQCFLVTGFTNGERHAWDMARVNGEYYYLDPTWGDASYAYSGSGDQEDGGFAPSINYDYFLVTTDEITRTHSFEKVVALPECTAVNDNYYVREGLYFEEYDEKRLADIFGSDEARTADYVTIKCGDDLSFGLMTQELIGSQKIFDFIDKRNTSIAYASNEEQRTISFWDIY